MKRTAAWTIVLLLAGALINVGVAWTCAWLRPEKNVIFGAGYRPEQVINSRFTLDHDHQAVFSGSRRGGVGWIYAHATVTERHQVRGESHTTTLNLYQCGWPFLALTGENRFGYHSSDDGLRGVFRMQKDLQARERMISFQPMPRGFAANTTLFALLAAVVVRGPKVMQRLLRSWRHRCLHCGYDLQRTAGKTCPECGAQQRGRNHSIIAKPASPIR